jgi:hypothetical protein
MDQSSSRNLFKPLNLDAIVGYPKTMPKDIHKWLPKFTGNDVVTLEDILYAIGVALLNESIKNEYVAMRLLAMSLNEDAQRWFRGLPDDHWYLMMISLSCSKVSGQQRKTMGFY